METSSRKRVWKTSRREIDYSHKTLVMAILNVTPDSFSDGGEFESIDSALQQTEKYMFEGADIIDVGGESTRPNSERVAVGDEILRVVPIIEEIKRRFDIPISIDTSKYEVAKEAFDAGAEVINDISGLRFDDRIATFSAESGAGLVLMHVRGDIDNMHQQSPVEDIVEEVSDGFCWSLEKAKSFGVNDDQICLDIGVGFSKTFEQNLELIAKLDKLCGEFLEYPILVGTSRKSFIGKILDDAPTSERINGTLATNAVSIWNGANIVRVHDVKEIVETIEVVNAIKREL